MTLDFSHFAARPLTEDERYFIGSMLERDDILVVFDGLLTKEYCTKEIGSLSWLRGKVAAKQFVSVRCFRRSTSSVLWKEDGFNLTLNWSTYFEYLDQRVAAETSNAAHDFEFKDLVTDKVVKFEDVRNVTLYLYDFNLGDIVHNQVKKHFEGQLKLKQLLPYSDWDLLGSVSTECCSIPPPSLPCLTFLFKAFYRCATFHGTKPLHQPRWGLHTLPSGWFWDYRFRSYGGNWLQ